jgi:uncharacterized membrane protein
LQCSTKCWFPTFDVGLERQEQEEGLRKAREKTETMAPRRPTKRMRAKARASVDACAEAEVGRDSVSSVSLSEGIPAVQFKVEFWGLLLLFAVVAYNAILVAPELRIGRLPLNDVVLHLAASERMEASFEHGEPFLDPWVSEWSLGYPIWRTYQPLPHIVAALALRAFRSVTDPAAIFAFIFYLLIVTFPVSVYVGARLFGLSPPAAGLAAILVFASSADGDPGKYGIGYGSVLWRGSGLYTQLFALHFLAISLGLIARALDEGGRRRRALAALTLAMTAMSHIIFGYAAFVSTVLLAVIGPRFRRAERLVRLLTVVVPALVLIMWFLLPAFLSRQIINHSLWENPVKWDSYGAQFILRELLSGRLLDFGRLPVLSALLAIGTVGTVCCYRDVRAKRLLGLTGFWLVLFFGRETWGRLVVFAGVPADLHMHRLEAIFELSAILMAAFGVTSLITMLAERTRLGAVMAGVLIAASVLSMGGERAGYLRQNRVWGEQNLVSYQAEGAELDAALTDVRAILAQRPGRVSAGMPSNWGQNFKIGSMPVWAFFSRGHFDQADFLYHAMSKTADIMVLRDETNRGHDVVFGIRALVAPTPQPMPAYFRRVSTHGRFTVYEASPEGYFGIVDIVGHYVGPSSTDYEPNAAWLNSNLLSWGQVISLDQRMPVGQAVDRWQPLPDAATNRNDLHGNVLSETKVDETYQAFVEVSRPAYAFVKITWSPDLVATVDGHSAILIHVTPGFGAVAIPPGQHEVIVRYSPGSLKPFLLLAGIAMFVVGCFAMGTSRFAETERAAVFRLASVGERLETPRMAAAGALVLLFIVAVHPLFRGKLIIGHDATAYPARLVEFTKAIAQRHLPPVWASDLSAGHGQPLFEFAPPLVYVAALPFYYLGFGLADSYQLGLALLFLLGSIAIYRVGRRLGTSRYSALGGATAWLFGPYVSLDLFVRAAFAEAAAVAVAPIALLGVLQAMDRPSARRIALGAIAVALIPLGHNVATLLVIPALLIIVLIRILPGFQSGFPKVGSGLTRFLPSLSGSVTIAAGLGLSAYFWVPTLLEKTLVHTDRLRQGADRWSDNLVWPSQLLWSKWGYGLSVPGPNDGMSFALGPAHLMLAIIGLLLVLRESDRRRKYYAITFAMAAGCAAWLSTYWATVAWKHVETLQYLVQPWRVLILPGLFLPLLVMFALDRLGFRWAAICVVVLVVFNLPHTEAQGFYTFDDGYYTPQSIAMKGMNTSTFEEYEPRWVEMRPPYYNQLLIGVSGPIESTEISRSAARQQFSVQALRTTKVETATFFYPGWTISIDGAPAKVTPSPARGTMLFEVPAGQHQIVVELHQTPTRRTALSLSLVTCLLLAVGMVMGRLHGAEYWKFWRREPQSPAPGAAPSSVRGQ